MYPIIASAAARQSRLVRAAASKVRARRVTHFPRCNKMKQNETTRKKIDLALTFATGRSISVAAEKTGNAHATRPQFRRLRRVFEAHPGSGTPPSEGLEDSAPPAHSLFPTTPL